MLKFFCSNCSEIIIVKYLDVGESAKCRKCNKTTIIPDTALTTKELPQYLKESNSDDNSVPHIIIANKTSEFATITDLFLSIVILIFVMIIMNIIISMIIVSESVDWDADSRTLFQYKKHFDYVVDELENNVIFNLILSIILYGSIMFVSWYFVCFKYNLPFFEGFKITEVSTGAKLISILIGVCLPVITVSVLLIFLLKQFGITHFLRINYISLSNIINLINIKAVKSIMTAPIEEIYFRGFVFSVIERKKGSYSALIIVTIIFSSLHIHRIFSLYGGILFLYGIIPSFIFTLQRYKYKSLTPSIISHCIYNMTYMILLVCVQSYIDSM